MHTICKLSLKEISKREYGDAEGSHATPSEVSLTYFGYPEDGARVKRDELTPRIAPRGPIYDADDFRGRFADGRMGSDPTLSTAEIGQELFEASVRSVGQAYDNFITAG